MLSPQSSLIGGSHQEVIDKLLYLKENMGLNRYVGQIDIGGQEFKYVIRDIELFAHKIAPAVRNN